MADPKNEKDHSWVTPEVLAAWREEAQKYPSGMPCNGIHDRTPDARILVLIDMLTPPGETDG